VSTTPTQRTLKALKERGFTCGIVERFNRFGGPFGIRQDLFGFIDIIAIHRIEGIVGVQSCGQAFSAHYKKITEEKYNECQEWLLCGGKVELYGWRKLKVKRGGKAMRWTPRVLEITQKHLDEVL
jgi:hypothetical protein